MTENRYTGETEIDLGGKKCTLVYTWKALTDLRTKLKDEFDVKGFAIEGLDIDKIALFLEAGLAARHPEMTKEAILALDPPAPIIPAMTIIQVAMNRAITGKDTSQKEPESPPGLAAKLMSFTKR